MKIKIVSLAFVCLMLLPTLHVNSELMTYNPREKLKENFRKLYSLNAIDSRVENMATIMSMDYKYPINDELTELNDTLPTDDLMVFIEEIDIPGYGYWWPLCTESDALWINTYLVGSPISGERSIGGVRCGGNIFPFTVVFEFDAPFNAIQWDTFSFWWQMAANCEPYVLLGFIDTEIRMADYFWGNISYKQWKWFEVNLKGLEDPGWEIDEGFDWTNIKYILFATDAFGDPEGYFTTSWILVDLPMFWRDPDSIPHGLIDVDEVRGNYGRLCALLYHDGQESVPEYDFYAIKCTIEDISEYRLNTYISPYIAIIYIEIPDINGEYEEFPANHVPQSGAYGSQQLISFSYHGIGFTLYTPAYTVEYNAWHENGRYKIQWQLQGALTAPMSLGGFLFEEYAEVGVGIRVPAGKKPRMYVHAQIYWYTCDIQHIFFQKRFSETLEWAIVDPPGAPTVTPTAPIQDAPEFSHSILTTIDYVATFAPDMKTPKTTFSRQDSYIWVRVNYTWNYPNQTMFVVTIAIQDSSGKETFLFGVGCQMDPGYYLPQKQYWFGATLCIPPPSYLANGEAKIIVRVSSNWPWSKTPIQFEDETIWIDSIEYARTEIVVTITP